MARIEQNREDLLAEATALVERIELRLPFSDEPLAVKRVVAGFRRSGAASFFFGADPVYQFNSAGELRRMFAGGLLYKADDGRLVGIDRSRGGNSGRIELILRPLQQDAQRQLCDEIARRLSALATALSTGTATVLRQVPPDVDVRRRVLAWLEQQDGKFPLAAGPQAF